MPEIPIPPESGLDVLVAQMKSASDVGLWFPALLTALALPDICGALGSDNGRASGSKYRAWASKYITAENDDTSSQLYKLRCSLLHQGSMNASGDPVAFMVPDERQGQLHNITVQISPTEQFAMMSIPAFVVDVADGVTLWLSEVRGTDRFARNIARAAHLRHDDLRPAIADAWVIR